MIPLGTMPLKLAEDVAVTRSKVYGLSRALQFDAVGATRIAFAVSEQCRALLQAGREPELRITLEPNGDGTDLVLQFHDRQQFACAKGLSEFFDASQLVVDPSGQGCSLNWRVAAPPSAFGLDEGILQHERARLAQKTRNQLMDELQIKNQQLEEYNLQLEHMVAARTAELQKAYEKIKRDLETAADYVQRLIPPECEQPVAIRWKYAPSADLGGDIFGYHAVDDEHLAIYLLDVTGHGVDSALLAVSIVNVIRSASLPSVDFRRPGQVLAALNNAFPMEQFGDKMFTMWYGVFDTAARVLRWSGAGHPPALLFPSGACTPHMLGSFGPMAGMIGGAEFEEEECPIEQHARLFIYSDGAQEIELTDGAIWSLEEFFQYMSEICHSAEPLQALLDHVQQLHGREQLDDDFSAIEVLF
jgi:serine phosphatase RsbU (regulator of sigma subunit)